MMRFTVGEARRYAQDGRLEDWVHAFLTTIGRNEPFSLGLRRQERFWAGPVLFPLTLLARCLGPEECMEYRVSSAQWAESTSAMRASMARGWKPAPLIVEYRNPDVLSIRDGNHRYGALTEIGVLEYWTIFWCSDEGDRRTFAEVYARYLDG